MKSELLFTNLIPEASAHYTGYAISAHLHLTETTACPLLGSKAKVTQPFLFTHLIYWPTRLIIMRMHEEQNPSANAVVY